MELSTSSFSNEIDKSIQEDFSVSQAAIDEIKLRKEKGQKPESISNEEIKKGDPILDTYKVLDDAIHGGMGSVWRVHHESWNTDLAMKRPQPRFFAEGSEARKEEFIKECENWINLGLHPNIVSCYYVREIGGVPTIFSEWMDNGSLKDRIKDGSLYEGTEEEVQERILDIAIQTVRGLQYSHENNLVHQDVKPGNILLTKDWDAKVADFGLAKAQSQLTENEKPVSTGYTIQYCPREQAEGAPAEKWMDVYAWALTVLEMYAGKRLWDSGDEATRHCAEYFTSCRETVPEQMAEIILGCLRKSGANAQEIEHQLLDLYEELNGAAYFRPDAKAASDTAGSLNNRALSFLDLGYEKEALALWEEAIRHDAGHQDSQFNRALFLVRSSRSYDYQAISYLDSLEKITGASLSDPIRRECGGIYEYPKESPPEYIIAGEPDSLCLYKDQLYMVMLGGERRDELIGLQCMPKYHPDKCRTDNLDKVRKWVTEAKSQILHTCLCPEKKLAAVMLLDGSLCLYSLRIKRILRKTRSLNSGLKFLFHPDGSFLAVWRESGKGLTVRTTLLSIPWFGTLLREEMEFVCFLPKGRCLLRGKSRGALESLYLFEGKAGSLREVYSFSEELEEHQEYAEECAPLLCYKYKESGKTFVLDENLREIPVSAKLFEDCAQIYHHDPSRGLVFTCCGEQRLAVWDYRQGKCLFTARFHWTVRHLWDPTERQFLNFTHLSPGTKDWRHRTCWFPVALPEQNPLAVPAKWRVSKIVTTGQRAGQDRIIATLIRQFQACREKGDLAQAVQIHSRCCEIEGFFMHPEAEEMSRFLEKNALRKSIQTVRTLGEIPEIPKIRILAYSSRHSGDEPYDEYCALACSDGLLAIEARDDGDCRIILFDREGTLVREIPFPRYVRQAKVRGDRVFAFRSNGQYEVYDLQGKLIAAPSGETTPTRSAKSKAYYVCHDMDRAGERILCERKDMPGISRYFYQKDLRSGRILHLAEERRTSPAARYLKDGSILLLAGTSFRRFSPEDGSLLSSWSAEAEDVNHAELYLSAARDLIFAVMRRKYGVPNLTLLYDMTGSLLAQWEGMGQIVPLLQNRFIIENEGKRIRDILENQVVYHISGESVNQVCIRPDGKEFYVAEFAVPTHYQEKETKRLTVWRIEYEYEVPRETLTPGILGLAERAEPEAARQSGVTGPEEGQTPVSLKALDNLYTFSLPGEEAVE